MRTRGSGSGGRETLTKSGGWRRLIRSIVLSVLVLAAIAVSTELIFRHLDSKHAAFYQVGTGLSSFLYDYCDALEAAHSESSPEVLLGLYSPTYQSMRGSWQWAAPEQEGGVEIVPLRAAGPAPMDVPNLETELRSYLGGLQAIDRTVCKIDVIEEAGADVATLTVKFVLDGIDDGGPIQDRHFYRWQMTEAPGVGWRILADELVDGVRVRAASSAFAEVEAESIGIAYRHRRDPKLDPEGAGRALRFQLIEHAGGGLSAADFDGDLRPDLFFADGIGSRLFRNVTEHPGAPRFVDVTETAGVGTIDQATGALFLDFDNDGDRDLFVTRYLASNRYFVNLGDGSFEDRSAESGLNLDAPSASATALDYDRDGLPDLYVAVYGNAVETFPRVPFYARNGDANRLFRNEGDGHFLDVTESSGAGDTGWSLAVAVADADDDGWPDLLVANDFGRKTLLRNNGDGTFTDQARDAGVLDFSGGMGIVAGDFDGDGLADLYTSNIKSNNRWFGQDITLTQYMRNVVRTRWALLDIGEYASLMRLVGSDWRKLGYEIGEGNSLFRNLGDGTFEELKDSDTHQAGWGWSVAFFDFDNDADLDIYAANGWISQTPGTDL